MILLTHLIAFPNEPWTRTDGQLAYEKQGPGESPQVTETGRAEFLSVLGE